MKKTRRTGRFLCQILTIVFFVTCFPIFAFAENDNTSWSDETSLKTYEASIETKVEFGTLVPVINFAEDSFYNGYPQTLVTINPDPEGPELDPKMVEITYKGKKINGEDYAQSTLPPTDAGTYIVSAQYKGDDVYTSIEKSQTIKIKPIELKTTGFITEKPVAKIYDGNTNVPDTLIQGLGNIGVINVDIDTVVFNYKSANFLSKDVKSLNPNQVVLNKITISGSKAQNYVIVEENNNTKAATNTDVFLIANINPKPIEVILTGQDKTYDGTANLYEYELSVNQADLIKGEDVGAFGAENFYPWYGDINTKQENVGTYPVWASGGFYLFGINGTNADNYIIKKDTIISKKKYEITPAAVTVIPSYVSKKQGTADPALTYAVWQDSSGDGFVKGLYGDDVLYGSLERESGEAVGTYDVLLGSLNNPNYRITLTDGNDKFEILKNEESIATYTGNDYDNSGNGSEEAEAKPPVPYFGIALLLLLLLAGAAFYGKNRLTKMD